MGAPFFILILLTWIGSYIDQRVPYFPIEISRTAAGYYGYIGLCTGTLLLCPYLQGRSDGWLPWIGLLILAIIDDETSWTIHMFGVAVMVAGVAWNVYNDSKKLIILFCIGCIFVGRVIIRFIAIYAIEKNKISPFQVMYDGKCDPLTLIVFKLSGILQWVCFWAMYQLLQ